MFYFICATEVRERGGERLTTILKTRKKLVSVVRPFHEAPPFLLIICQFNFTVYCRRCYPKFWHQS